MKFRKLTALLLLAVLTVQLFGCGTKPQQLHAPTTEEPLPTVTTEPTVATEAPDPVKEPREATLSTAAADFSANLLRQTHKSGENTTLSPYSVLTALAMTVNGADGETLAQMESVLGLPVDKLNSALLACREQAGEELVVANSLWIRDGFEVQSDFLQANVDYYTGAEVYQTDFDSAAVDAVNGWVAEHTKDRIKKMVDQFNPLTMLCLINALTFDAKWESEFYEESVYPEDFHAADGTTRQVDMMHGAVSAYLSSDSATGFVKPYAGGRYSFVGLLPNEDIDIEDYVNRLDGNALLDLMESRSEEEVIINLPVFKTEYAEELSGALSKMGMPLAFDAGAADFTRIAGTEPPLYISAVLHKTYVSVDGAGTEAAAATLVMVECTSAAPSEDEPEPKYVILDRPFVWMIWDEQNSLPVFIGVTDSITE